MNSPDPIKSIDKLKQIKEYLKEENTARNYLLFVLGINSALRISDLLGLKIKDTRKEDGSLKEHIYLRESKTSKEQKYHLSESAKEALRYYFDEVDPNQDDWLFPSQKGGHIGRTWAWTLVSRWGNKFDVEGICSPHSLRKTYGFMARKKFDMPIELIQSKFNHSSPGVTRRYVGIAEEEIAEMDRKVSL